MPITYSISFCVTARQRADFCTLYKLVFLTMFSTMSSVINLRKYDNGVSTIEAEGGSTAAPQKSAVGFLKLFLRHRKTEKSFLIFGFLLHAWNHHFHRCHCLTLQCPHFKKMLYKITIVNLRVKIKFAT